MNYRSKTVGSLLGDVRLERAYYHCPHCHQGHFPWDQVLRLTDQRLTPAAQEVLALAGLQQSFSKVAERALYKTTGLRYSESTVQRTTEAAGTRLDAALVAGTVFGPPSPYDWHHDRTGQTCAYISIDATGIQMQGPGGAKADGRMVYVAMIYNPQPRAHDADDTVLACPCDGVRYQAGLTTLTALGDQVRRQAAQVGLEHVDQWIALSDAGNGLEQWFDVYFPRATKIVDFRHATEHLTPLAQRLGAARGDTALLTSWCHQLKHAGGSAVLAELEQLDRAGMDAATQAAHAEALTYFRNHAGRMNYPEYLRRGWQIGSGCIESGCKTVINQRLNMGGMRWGEAGGDALAQLRALFCSDADQWDAFWSLAL